MPDDDCKFLNRYDIEKVLGHGTFGKVKLAFDSQINRRVNSFLLFIYFF